MVPNEDSHAVENLSRYNEKYSRQEPPAIQCTYILEKMYLNVLRILSVTEALNLLAAIDGSVPMHGEAEAEPDKSIVKYSNVFSCPCREDCCDHRGYHSREKQLLLPEKKNKNNPVEMIEE